MQVPGKMKLSIVCLLAGILAVQSASITCPYDACTCTNENIDCTNRGLTALPPLNPGTFPQHDLDISGNKITTIGDDELPHNLQDIRSSGNPITTIGDHAFIHSNESLRNLEIKNGLFTVLPKALEDLDSLAYLGLINGKLKTIPDGPELLPNVYYIDFGNNEIEDITNIKRFKYSLLTRLDFRGNQISNISAVSQLTNIRTLKFYENKICDHDHISKALIPHQDTLQGLNLDRNCLTKIPDVSALTNLERLWLKQNQIDDCQSGAFPDTLFDLRLQKNKLSCRPQAIFQSPNLTVLQLFNNEFTTIDDFPLPWWITELLLQYNNFRGIIGLRFDKNPSKLEYLNLQGNSMLDMIDDNAFVNIPNLQRIDLRDTNFMQLPLALKSLTSLTSLKISSNQLTCTCAAASLSGWWTGASRLAEGRCGATEVNDYLNQLSTNCPNVIG